MTIGSEIRMRQILRRSDGRAVVVALDHGGIAGPIAGIEDPAAVVRACVEGGADAVLATRGVAKAALGEWDRGTALLLRLTGGFTVLGGGFEEELICEPATAAAYGAAGVAMTVKFGHAREGYFIRQASLAICECERLGLPVMIEAIGVAAGKRPTDPACVRLAARAAQELGADIVKAHYTGDPESFRAVVSGCPAPVLVLGGEKAEGPEPLFRDVYDSLLAGGAGVAIGRNVWGGGDALAMVEALVGLVHEGWSVERAMKRVG